MEFSEVWSAINIFISFFLFPGLSPASDHNWVLLYTFGEFVLNIPSVEYSYVENVIIFPSSFHCWQNSHLS